MVASYGLDLAGCDRSQALPIYRKRRRAFDCSPNHGTVDAYYQGMGMRLDQLHVEKDFFEFLFLVGQQFGDRLKAFADVKALHD